MKTRGLRFLNPGFRKGGHIVLQKYRDRNGRCIAILFKSIGVRVDVTLLIKGGVSMGTLLKPVLCIPSLHGW